MQTNIAKPESKKNLSQNAQNNHNFCAWSVFLNDKMHLLPFLVVVEPQKQVLLRQLSFNLNTCQVITAILIFQAEIRRKSSKICHNFAGIEIQAEL